jgi:hypothetical protein
VPVGEVHPVVAVVDPTGQLGRALRVGEGGHGAQTRGVSGIDPVEEVNPASVGGPRPRFGGSARL